MIDHERVYREVEHAIANRLHLGGPAKTPPWVGVYSIHFRYPVAIEKGDIILRDSDCGLAKPTMMITTDEWVDRRERFGLFKRVGFYRFVPATDPAAAAIAYCERDPEGAGRELHRLRVEKLGGG